MIGNLYGYSVKYWQSQLATAAPDLDVGAMLKWIEQESGGIPTALGKVYEVGIVQVDTEDGPFQSWSRETLHGTGTFASAANAQTLTRALTSDEESTQVQAAIAYFRQALAAADAAIQGAGGSWSNADRWALAKWWHALPVLVTHAGGGSL